MIQWCSSPKLVTCLLEPVGALMYSSPMPQAYISVNFPSWTLSSASMFPHSATNVQGLCLPRRNASLVYREPIHPIRHYLPAFLGCEHAHTSSGSTSALCVGVGMCSARHKCCRQNTNHTSCRKLCTTNTVAFSGAAKVVRWKLSRT